MIYEKSKISNKEMEIILKKQTAIVKLKNIITEIKILLEGFNIRFEQTEERINELKTSQLKL